MDNANTLPAMSMGLSLMGAAAKISAGKIQQREAELSAKSEEVAAIQREADRKSRLAKAMASQIASAGSKGIAAFEGSPLAILEEDIRQEKVATERDVLNARLAAMTKRATGKVAKSSAYTSSLLGITKDVVDIAPTLKAD